MGFMGRILLSYLRPRVDKYWFSSRKKKNNFSISRVIFVLMQNLHEFFSYSLQTVNKNKNFIVSPVHVLCIGLQKIRIKLVRRNTNQEHVLNIDP